MKRIMIIITCLSMLVMGCSSKQLEIYQLLFNEKKVLPLAMLGEKLEEYINQNGSPINNYSIEGGMGFRYKEFDILTDAISGLPNEYKNSMITGFRLYSDKMKNRDEIVNTLGEGVIFERSELSGNYVLYFKTDKYRIFIDYENEQSQYPLDNSVIILMNFDGI